MMDESFILEIEVCQLNEALDLYIIVGVNSMSAYSRQAWILWVHSDVSNR